MPRPLRLIALSFLFALVTLPTWAVELRDGRLPRTTTLSGTEATLAWETDVVCGTRVRYGLAPDKLTSKFEGSVVTNNHVANLQNLTPGTTYYYTVGSAKVVLHSGSFTTTTAPRAPIAKFPPMPPAAKADSPRPPPATPTAKPVAPIAAQPKAKPAPAPARKAPPARLTWGSMPSLQDHFDRHGPDFGSRDPEEYAAQAWQFLQRAMDEGWPAKYDDEDGTIRIFDPKTGAFAAYRRDGRTRTYFKPGSRDYFNRQPGRPIKLKRS